MAVWNPPRLATCAALVPLAIALGCAAQQTTDAPEPPEEADASVDERVDLRGRQPVWRWASDGVHLVRGRGADEKWVHPVTWEESAPPPQADSEDGGTDGRRAKLQQALLLLEGIDEAKAEKLAERAFARWTVASDDGQARLVRDGDAYIFYREGEGASRLDAFSRKDVEQLMLAPDGSALTYVLENDLHLLTIADGVTRALTDDGGPDRYNGKLDWVYQEEIYGRGDYEAQWWSPDSQHLAFLSLDERLVEDYVIVDHIPPGHYGSDTEITRYPKAGAANPVVSLGFAQAKSGEVVWADLSGYELSEPLVVRVGWTPDGDQAWFIVQDRVQSWADLCFADPTTGEWRNVLNESQDTWVERPRAPLWLADGTFLWQSDRTDHTHLYHYDREGQLLRAVTSGDWSVNSVKEVDEERGLVWFTATKDGAVDRNLYRIGLDGQGLVRLTPGRGTHRTSFNADRSLLLDRVSSLAKPTEVRLVNGVGELLKVLGETELDVEQELAQWELVEIPAHDGYPIDAAILRPLPFDPEERYPVWLPTYSGPDAPSVRNSWNTNSYYQTLARRGFIVFQVNVRTASGKGHWATELCHERLGAWELSDLVDAVDWLTAKPWADAERVGISGGSYGGFIAAYALTHCDRFALGVASSGVYDWQMYDTIYTERYMGLPESNPDGYLGSSVVEGAADLHGHLLMAHGTLDDNVHVQNAMQLAYALQTAGKQFELMCYPQCGHGIGGPQGGHWRALTEQRMQSVLGGPRD